MKLTKRKGFNFFRSYYDVYNELEKDKDKLQFIEALLNRQFLGIKPTNLKGMAVMKQRQAMPYTKTLSKGVSKGVDKPLSYK